MNMNYTVTSLLLFALLATGCNHQPQSTQNDIATPVSVTELKKGSISKLVNTTGTAQPTCGVTLNSEMSGLYKLQTNPRTGKPFKLGDIVSKGQLIVRLEDREYENGIAIDAKELSLEIAEQEQVKQKALYEKGGVTLSEMRNTEVKVTNARYDYENGKLNLEKMNVRAPFDGVIVDLPHYTSDVRIEQGKPVAGIMDYARNNFVAQPGDFERGVRLTPPPVGVYDIHAINWGYRLIPGAKTMEDEKPTLEKWIREKDGDKMYEFGAQQFLGLIDPTD